MLRRSLLATCVLTLCLGLASGGAAEARDLTGVWDFTASIVVPPCTWTGPAEFTQGKWAVLSPARATLDLTSGTFAQCQLAAISGDVTVAVTGNTVQFGLATAAGPVTFDGTIDGSGDSMDGTWGLLTLTGTWSATRQPTVPTLAEWGALTMLLRLLAGGVYALRQRPTTASWVVSPR